MTTPRLEAAQQRLARLLEQKKALEARISREQGLLRKRERKARTRRLIEYGGLVAITGLDEEDKGTVLGLLLEGARRLPVDAKARQRWKVLGDKELEARARQAVAQAARVGQDIAYPRRQQSFLLQRWTAATSTAQRTPAVRQQRRGSEERTEGDCLWFSWLALFGGCRDSWRGCF